MRIKINFPKFHLKWSKEQSPTSSEETKKASPPYILFPDTEREDFFSRSPIISAVAKAISASRGQMNFLISGEWGMGKTRILKGIENSLKSQGITTVWFSPWKYTSNSSKSNVISRAFLIHLSEIFGKPHEIEKLYRSEDFQGKRNVITQFIGWIFTVFTLTLYLFLLIVLISWAIKFLDLSWIDRIDPSGVFTFITNGLISKKVGDTNNSLILSIGFPLLTLWALPKIAEGINGRIIKTGTQQVIDSPEEFEKIFHSLMKNCLKYSWIQKIVSIWEQTFDDTFLYFLGRPLTEFFVYRFLLRPARIQKLVVFIDDLDRCDEDEVKEFLTSMKTFLEHQRVYFIVAADMGKLRALANKNEPEFLRKIIQLDWSVPYISELQIKGYLRKIALSSGYSMSESEAEKLATICRIRPNPRKIKYYLRRLLFIINLLYEDKDNKETYDCFISREDNRVFLFKLIVIADIFLPFFNDLRVGIGSEFVLEDIENGGYEYFPKIEESIEEKLLGSLPKTHKSYVGATTLPDEKNTQVQGEWTLEYEKKKKEIKNNCEKCRAVLTSPVRSARIWKPKEGLSWYFSQVSSAEGEPIDVNDFIEYAETEHDEAFRDLQADQEHIPLRMQELMENIDNSLTRNPNLKLQPDGNLDESGNKLRSKITFCIKFIEKQEYLAVANQISLFQKLLSMLKKSSSETIKKLVWTDNNDLRGLLFRRAITEGAPEFWTSLFNDSSQWQDFSDAEWLFDLVTPEEIEHSPSKEVLEEFVFDYLPEGKQSLDYKRHFRAIRLIDQKKLIFNRSLREVGRGLQRRMILFFKTTPDPTVPTDRDEVFNIILSNLKKLLPEIIQELLEEVITKSEYAYVNKIIEKIIIENITVEPSVIQSILIPETEDVYDNEDFRKTFEILWKARQISDFGLNREDVIEKVTKIISRSTDRARSYKDFLVQRDQGYYSALSSVKNEFIEGLKKIKSVLSGLDQAQITRYINLTQNGGKSYVRRRKV